MSDAWRDRLFLALAAFPLLLCGLTWGLPRAVSPETVGPWGYDELAPLQPLNEAYSRFNRERSSYLPYPLFHYVVLAAADAPYLGWQYATGRLHPATSYPYGMSDPVATCRDLVVIGRLVSVLMAVGIVWATYATARTLFDRQAARWAGALVAVLPLLTYYGKISTLDVPYTFWFLLAVACAAKVVARQAKLRHYVLLGVCTGLAVATKDQALGYLVLYPVLLVGVRLREGPPWRAVASRENLCGLAAAVVTFALANNLLLGGRGFLRHLEVISAMSALERAHGSDLAGQLGLLGDCAGMLAWVLGPALLLAAAGVAALARARRWGVLGLLLLPPLGHQLVILGRVGYAYPRHMLPTAVLLILAGAAALHHARGTGVCRAARLVALLGVLYGGALSLNLDYVLVNDARYRAEQWIAANVAGPSTFEAYTSHERTLPRSWGENRLRLVGREDMRLDRLHERHPDYVLVTDLLEHSVRTAPEAAAFLGDLFAGRAGYRRVGDWETPGLLPARFGRLINCIAPHVTIFRREDAPPS